MTNLLHCHRHRHELLYPLPFSVYCPAVPSLGARFICKQIPKTGPRGLLRNFHLRFGGPVALVYRAPPASSWPKNIIGVPNVDVSKGIFQVSDPPKVVVTYSRRWW